MLSNKLTCYVVFLQGIFFLIHLSYVEFLSSNYLHNFTATASYKW